ncbi:MAG: hypothetical protein Kow00109_17580 [Acidobacteriota bacterium]
MKRLLRSILTVAVAAGLTQTDIAQSSSTEGKALDPRERSIVRIAALTAAGDQERLAEALAEGLEAGLTINQGKAVLEHLYAYCGFPRSLNALLTFQRVVGERRARGIRDEEGESYEPVPGGDRYERGRRTLEKLTGRPQPKPAPGYGEFSPEIDRFLKEHLFADIFDNPLLSYRERELATISALSAMDGVEPQLRAHLAVGRNNGITEIQLAEVADLIDEAVGRTHANRLRRLLGRPEVPVADENLVVRMAEIRIDPARREEYLAILREEATASLEREPGVICILPLTFPGDPSRVRILEVYRNRAAYEAHLQSPHFQHYKTATQDMVQGLELIDLTPADLASMQRIFGKLR